MTSPTHDHEPRTIDRRKLVRTGAALAWTVPAIQVAAAAPALAASGCCDLSVSGTAGWRPGELNYIDIPLKITNGCSGAVSGLTVGDGAGNGDADAVPRLDRPLGVVATGRFHAEDADRGL